MERERRKRKFLLFLLLYLVVFTSVLSMITLSKYSSVSSGNGSMKIAKWNVTLNTSNNQNDNINLISGNNEASYTLTVESLSDVKVGYSIIISNIPNGIKVKLDNGSYKEPSSGTISFNNVGVINANATSNQASHTLTFSATLGSQTISSKKIDMDVKFIQLQ